MIDPLPTKTRPPRGAPIKLLPAAPSKSTRSDAPSTGGQASTSHNTFRPDIYRVSEGYLN